MHTHSLHSRATRRRGEAKALHPLPEGEGGVRGQSPMRTFPAGDRVRGLNILDCLSPKGGEPVASVYEYKARMQAFLKCTEDDRACRIRMFAGCILWVTFLRAIKKGDKEIIGNYEGSRLKPIRARALCAAMKLVFCILRL